MPTNPITFTRGTDDQATYPVRLSRTEKKLVETVYSNAPQYEVVEYAAAAADYAILTDDGIKTFLVNDAITLTMPNASDNTGRRILFVQKAAAVLTVAQNADDANIAGVDGNYVALDAANDRAEFISTGTEWLIVSSTIA